MRYPDWWQGRSYLSNILLPLSLLYSFLGYLRRLIAHPIILPAKVICIGNVTVGGTGKTQVVLWLVEKLQKQGIKVVVIAKGYKGQYIHPTLVKDYHSTSWVGDEPKYMSKFVDVIVARNPRDCIKLARKLEPDVIILDDFLQNPYVTKDAIIVVIDDDRMFGNNRIFPAGPLRQKISEVKFDAIIAIGSSEFPSNKLPSGSLFAQITTSSNLKKDARYLAFAGIGNPERFFNCLKNHGLKIVQQIAFPDHHNYSNLDVQELESRAKKLKAVLLTTPKDAVKLGKLLEFEEFIPTLNFLDQDAEEQICSAILNKIDLK